MTENTIRKSIYLRATPAQVWAYLTEPAKLGRWFHAPKAPLAMGDYALYAAESGTRIIWGEVRAAEPFTRLAYTFIVPPMGDLVSSVTWTLEELETGTRLSLVHEGIPQGVEAFGLTLALDEGWDEHMGRLRTEAHS